MQYVPIDRDRSVPMPAWALLLMRREFWGGVTLVAIWLAVLFVGIFGGSVQSNSTDGSSTSFPVVVIVALVALFATISVGRWAFGRRGEEAAPADSDPPR